MADGHEHKYEILSVAVPSLPGADGPAKEVEPPPDPDKKAGDYEPPPARKDEVVEMCRACGDVKRRKPTSAEVEMVKEELER